MSDHACATWSIVYKLQQILLDTVTVSLGALSTSSTADRSMTDLSTASPPPFLAKLLQLAKNEGVDTIDSYDDFLLYAERSSELCRTSSLLITASHKVAIPFVPATLKVSSTMDPLDDFPSMFTEDVPDSATLHSRRKSSSKLLGDAEVNTLVAVFHFYSSEKQISFHHLTFTLDDISSSRMTFKQAEIFCSDFRIIPKLLTRDDLKMIWEDLAVAYYERGLGQLHSMDLMAFKDLIVRMALWAYQKPGLKKLILTVEGFMPTTAGIITCFCTYLGLHDSDHIFNFLRSISKQIEEDKDFRKHGGLSEIARLEMRLADDVKRIDKLKKTTIGKLHSPPESPKTRLNRARNEFNQFKEDVQELDSHSISNQSAAFQRSLNSYSRIDVFGDKLKVATVASAANPMRVVRSASSSSRSSADVHITRTPETASRLPEQLQERLSLVPSIGTAQALAVDDSHGSESFRVSHKLSQQKKGPKGLGSAMHLVHDDEGDDDESSAAWSQSSQLDQQPKQFSENSIGHMRENMRKMYDSRLTQQLGVYSHIEPRLVISDWIESRGPFVDLGLLDAGAKITIQLRLSNGSPDEVFVDVTTRNFRSDDTHIRTLAKPLISGFARMITIEFSAPRQNCTVLGFVDILNLAVRKGESHTISCPVFYRIDSEAQRDRMPRCNAGRLPDLLGTRMPNRTRKFVATFEQRKALDGSWSNVRTRSLKLTPLQLTKTRPHTSQS